MKRPNRIISSIWLLMLYCGVAKAQSPFKYRAALAKVDSTGYYRINLQPAVTAKSKSDLADIRIQAADNVFVPYVKTGDLPVNTASKFITFPQVKAPAQTDSTTVYIAQNITGAPIHSLWVRLKNTSVERSITLTGSDDRQQWFAISENIPLAAAETGNDKDTYQQQLNFPASGYRYLKLTINNGHKNPVNMLEAGIYTYLPVVPKFVLIPSLKYKQVDSANHITHLVINFDEPYQINKLHISASGQSYFKRQVKIYTNDTNHTWLTEQYWSNDDPDINLTIKSKSLDVEIVNNDDQPLHINTVQALQVQSYVVARLEAGKPYFIVTGNAEARAPKYDLQFFTEKISPALPEITHQEVGLNPAYKTTAAKPDKKTYPWLIWVAIGAAIIVLLTLTLKMAKEVGKK